MSFFSNAPDGFQRPTPRSDFDYWEGVAEIQEQLSAPEQVNTIYISMMQPLMEAMGVQSVLVRGVMSMP